jgi:hypothetical protein
MLQGILKTSFYCFLDLDFHRRGKKEEIYKEKTIKIP